MIDRLPPRERQIFDALCARREATAAEILSDIPDGPSNSAIRIMLGRLERKGLVAHRVVLGRFVYSVTLSDRAVKGKMLRYLVHTFFDGSPSGAAAALIGMADKVDGEELDRLEQLIAEARARST